MIKSHNDGICGTRRRRIASYPTGAPILKTTDCGTTFSTVVLFSPDRTNVVKGDDTSKPCWFFERNFTLLILLAMWFPLHFTINATSALMVLSEMGGIVVNWYHIVSLRMR